MGWNIIVTNEEIFAIQNAQNWVFKNNTNFK